MSVDYIEHPDDRTIEIVVDGKVTEAVFDAIAPQMEAFIAAHGRVKLLEIIRELDGFELSMLGKGIKFDIQHLKSFSHCAVVSDKGWIGPLARAMSPFFDIEIRTFPPDEEAAARAWLRAA